ncbi:hypothetical protein PV10_04635 [Exophiala mesophila]|uniref:Spindle pole body component n=1 Tax=Exophiala mesophila TaxID=212818 RepID=A0A0D1ZFA4_EXOME|nr:uncharacterized protein PV10_04635 [Exophiala mesophila]KIV93422.1 hypothetical protein PV10_04635 [Exophiala mesophila]
MLHEILLSLSGIHSPAWDQVRAEDREGSGLNQYVSPPERSMLNTLSHLHDLHVAIKQETATIVAKQTSMICRALASSVSDVQLAKFTHSIVHVESSILNKDAGYVAAYGIVPLSTIVSELAPWTRRLEWMSAMVQYLKHSSGAAALDRLERERHTGYSDIEDMVNELLRVGHTAWMRAANLWILFGKLPTSGREDFCVRPNPNPSSFTDAFVLQHSLLPGFVKPRAAQALLSIGSALNQLHSQSLSKPTSLGGSIDHAAALLPGHLKLLESLHYPIDSSHLESTLVSINQSISENALSQILPVALVRQLLEVIHSYVLLQYGEFAVSLVGQADDRITARHQTDKSILPIRKTGRLDGMTMKESELNSILNKTFGDLAAVRGDYESDEETFELSRKLLSLRPYDTRRDPTVISTLLPTPVSLHLTIPASSPLHIFLDPADAELYSRFNAYLLSVRRAGMHLSALWKVSPQRRNHPTPIGPPRSASQAGQALLAARRERDDRRSRRTRRHWVVTSKALFTINELESYLHGEVIHCSWDHLRGWMDGDAKDGLSSAKSSRPGTASSADPSKTKAMSTNSSLGSRHKGPPSDPRTLAEAHRVYLKSLSSALLICDDEYAQTLRATLILIDHFVALFYRIQTVWEGLDLQDDDGVVDAFSNYVQDEKEVLDEMDRTASNLETSLDSLVDSIKAGEKQSKGAVGPNNKWESLVGLHLDDSRFSPWPNRTIDRLIMKLDGLGNGRVASEDKDGSGLDDE